VSAATFSPLGNGCFTPSPAFCMGICRAPTLRVAVLIDSGPLPLSGPSLDFRSSCPAIEAEDPPCCKYTVTSGDTLSSIAIGFAITPLQLADANGFTTDQVLSLNQQIKVYPFDDETCGAGNDCKFPSKLVFDCRGYRIQAEDTLFNIASSFNVDPNAIVTLNNLPDVNAILSLGQVLLIPPYEACTESIIVDKKSMSTGSAPSPAAPSVPDSPTAPVTEPPAAAPGPAPEADAPGPAPEADAPAPAVETPPPAAAPIAAVGSQASVDSPSPQSSSASSSSSSKSSSTGPVIGGIVGAVGVVGKQANGLFVHCSSSIYILVPYTCSLQASLLPSHSS
jgi:LysM repeat protein